VVSGAGVIPCAVVLPIGLAASGVSLCKGYLIRGTRYRHRCRWTSDRGSGIAGDLAKAHAMPARILLIVQACGRLNYDR